jgi:hypothetical protein
MLLLLTLLACDDPAPPPAATIPTTPTKASIDTSAPTGEEEAAGEPTYQDQDRNRPPRLRDVSITPDPVRSIDDARVEYVAKDPDNDPVKMSFEWYVNGDRIAAALGETLAKRHFKKGDKISVEVIASDGRKETMQTTEEVEIANSPPEIELPRFGIKEIDGFQVTATDPDRDSLTFRLEDAPPGMSISRSGKLSFKPSMEQTEGGEFPTRIIAEDPDGEYAAWEMKLKLNPARSSTEGEAG